VWGVLLAPARLPGRVLETLDLVGAELPRVRKQTAPVADLLSVAEDLRGQLSDVLSVARDIRAQAEPLGEMLPALERVEGEPRDAA